MIRSGTQHENCGNAGTERTASTSPTAASHFVSRKPLRLRLSHAILSSEQIFSRLPNSPLFRAHSPDSRNGASGSPGLQAGIPLPSSPLTFFPFILHPPPLPPPQGSRPMHPTLTSTAAPSATTTPQIPSCRPSPPPSPRHFRPLPISHPGATLPLKISHEPLKKAQKRKKAEMDTPHIGNIHQCTAKTRERNVPPPYGSRVRRGNVPLGSTWIVPCVCPASSPCTCSCTCA